MLGPAKMGFGKAHKPQQANRSRSIALLCGVLMLFGVAYMSLTLARKASPAGAPSGKGGTQAVVAAQAAKEKLQRSTILAAKALDPLTMQYALPEGASFLSGYKTPCWKEGEALRCLPYAYILGSFQSGTNTLFAKLAEHPEVVTNEVSRWQFWAEEGKTMQGYVDKHSSGQSLKDIQADPKTKVILDGSSSAFAFYWSAGLRAHRAFQSVMVPCWRECSEGSKGKKEALMKCTEEKCFPRAMAADLKVASGLNLTYDQLHLPLLMSAAYGVTYKPRLMVLLRDPIDRLHCAYWQYHHYNHKYGKTAQGFLKYVKEQVGALKTCAARFVGQTGGDGKRMGAAAAERHCALYFEALGNAEEQIFFHADQFMRGMYAMYLEVWLRHFPKDSILVLRSEQYFANNEAAVDKVIAFLNLSTLTPANKKKMVQAGKPNSCKAAEKMLPEAEKILLDFYRPYNQQLADLLGDEQWLEYNAPRQRATKGAM